jgi:hypothetical protein
MRCNSGLELLAVLASSLLSRGRVKPNLIGNQSKDLNAEGAESSAKVAEESLFAFLCESAWRPLRQNHDLLLHKLSFDRETLNAWASGKRRGAVASVILFATEPWSMDRRGRLAKV